MDTWPLMHLLLGTFHGHLLMKDALQRVLCRSHFFFYDWRGFGGLFGNFKTDKKKQQQQQQKHFTHCEKRMPGSFLVRVKQKPKKPDALAGK